MLLHHEQPSTPDKSLHKCSHRLGPSIIICNSSPDKLHAVVKSSVGEFFWVLVGSRHLVKPHKEVSVVVLEEFVVHVVVCWGAKADPSKDSVPWEHVLGVNEHEPVAVQGSKGHVGPHVAGSYEQGGTVERDENHANRVGDASVESVKEPRVGEAMVRFVRLLIKRGGNGMLQPVHDILQTILNHQGSKGLRHLNATLETVIAFWHESQHPRQGEVEPN